MPTEPTHLTAEELEIREIVNRVSRAKQVLHDDDPALTLRAAVKLVDSLEAARRELAKQSWWVPVRFERNTLPGSSRVETGPMQFEDDWPGLFIRGDNAIGFAMVIERFLETKSPIYEAQVRGWLKTLRSCDARTLAAPPAQHTSLAPHTEKGESK